MSTSDFAEYLRLERVRRRLRQVDVADALGVSRELISHYETGRQRPPAERKLKIFGLFRQAPPARSGGMDCA